MLARHKESLNIYVGKEALSILPGNILRTKAYAEKGSLEVLKAINKHRNNMNLSAGRDLRDQFRFRQSILAAA